MIDVDDLIEKINKEMPQGSARGVFKAFIDEQPTAYSVENVIEELEKQRNIIFQDTDSEIKIVRANAWDKIDVLNKAIEIVKHGGVADDVCEWTLTDTRKVMPYKTSCDNEDLYDHRWKFCPYCGNKIKVVE